MEEKLVSKVLVLDTHREHRKAINALCAGHRLLALTASPGRLMSLLRTNIDLGAILCAEDYAGDIDATIALANTLHRARPELPLILRRSGAATLDDLPDAARRIFCAVFTLDDVANLRQIIDSYIFSLSYPNALVRGISEISEGILRNQFAGLSVGWDTPHIVRDRMIFGEVFTLIPLDSSWCRGYMLLQVEEAPVLGWLARQHGEGSDAPTFRAVNSLLGEITNLIWGAFKNRYIGDAAAFSGSQIQVPIIVNHAHRYISFGTENPQLCFRYTLTDEASGERITLSQRFIFNLSWSPEDFKEIDVAEQSDAGELEFF